MTSSFRLNKALRRMGFVALFCAFALNAFPWGSQLFRSFTETTAKDVAISVPKAIATCPHHPHGCPKDCMCPKTYVSIAIGHMNHEDRAAGNLREPTLVTCTENGPQSLTFSSATFLPSNSEAAPIFVFVSNLPAAKKIASINPFRKTPQKIPIV